MNLPLLVVGSTLVIVLVLALAREVRLRRALQRLLARLLAHWRNHDVEDTSHASQQPDRRSSAFRDRV
ncbi:unnamed protein product [marine sediment metagenome]|uniref:Uncharacterized protein n=1 Tax=marine sediment metagenome TaxID=412755 RepID=X0XDF1_9ZZZZ